MMWPADKPSTPLADAALAALSDAFRPTRLVLGHSDAKLASEGGPSILDAVVVLHTFDEERVGEYARVALNALRAAGRARINTRWAADGRRCSAHGVQCAIWTVRYELLIDVVFTRGSVHDDSPQLWSPRAYYTAFRTEAQCRYVTTQLCRYEHLGLRAVIRAAKRRLDGLGIPALFIELICVREAHALAGAGARRPLDLRTVLHHQIVDRRLAPLVKPAAEEQPVDCGLFPPLSFIPSWWWAERGSSQRRAVVADAAALAPDGRLSIRCPVTGRRVCAPAHCREAIVCLLQTDELRSSEGGTADVYAAARSYAADYRCEAPVSLRAPSANDFEAADAPCLLH